MASTISAKAVALVIVFAGFVGFADSADAHSLRISPDVSGLPIPSLTHGQMAVISSHRSEIHELAAWVAVKDEEIRKLLSYSRRQFRGCLWGVFPASLDDEDSPFNECSHAYLAADQEILKRMRDLPAWRHKALPLYERIERDMIEHGSSLVLCAYSATSFNTASLVEPSWHHFRTHIPSQAALIATFAAVAMAGIALARFACAKRSARPD